MRWLVIEPGDFFRSVVRFNLWRTRSQADQIEFVKNNNLETCMKDLGLNGGIHGPWKKSHTLWKHIDSPSGKIGYTQHTLWLECLHRYGQMSKTVLFVELFIVNHVSHAVETTDSTNAGDWQSTVCCCQWSCFRNNAPSENHFLQTFYSAKIAGTKFTKPVGNRNEGRY